MTQGAWNPLISVVVPVYNEEANVRRLYSEVVRVMAGLAERYDYEFIFTDNHSTDGTFRILEELAVSDERVRVLRFSRNFGFQRSILTGYRAARGVAAVELDADLQDPPDLIPVLIEEWEKGSDVVYGIRRSREESRWINWLRSLFYRTINRLSEDKLPVQAGDFRLVGRRVLDLLQRVDDQQPYLRGMIAGFGFQQTGIPYDRAKREHGESKFTLGQLARLAVDGISSHSVVPLRIATATGIVMAILTLILIGVYLIVSLFFGEDWPLGFLTTTLLLLLGISLNALFLGIIGEYLGRIYKQVNKRPISIVEKRLNFPDDKDAPLDR